MNKKKLGMTISSLALVGAIAVGGTLAYLSDTSSEVKNTFSLTENLSIVLDEAPVDENGNEISNQKRTGGNTYEDLYANQELDKDPTVTLKNNKINQYVFVAVKESSNVDVLQYNTTEHGGDWTEYTNHQNTGIKIFYQLVDIDDAQVDKVDNDEVNGYEEGIQLQSIFEHVKVANVESGTELQDILVGAATVQSDGIVSSGDKTAEDVAYDQISVDLIKLVTPSTATTPTE